MKNLLCVFLILTLFGSCRNAEPAVYYIPENFVGMFAVVYSQAEGNYKIVNGRRQFYIPQNRILLTKATFSSGWRDDIFLMRSGEGYDTLRIYLPRKDTTGKKFDKAYYKNYTSDSNEVAINFRQLVNPTFNKLDSSGNKIRSCSFTYELITIGKSTTLKNSDGLLFIERLDKYLTDTLCK